MDGGWCTVVADRHHQYQINSRMSKNQGLGVGSTVRLTSKILLPPKVGAGARAVRDVLTIARRSVVATEDERGCISLVQDDIIPTPLAHRGKFLITPTINGGSAQEVDECEADVSNVSPLLEFEQVEGGSIEGDIALYKGYGDQLFRINDYTWAISYYEATLYSVSSTFDVGSVLVVRRSGHSVIAELDCLENGTFDVTFQSGDEANITRQEIIMALWTPDISYLQPKILLNLSRCLLKLADFDSTRANSLGKSSRQDKFRQSAVLGSSAAITICEYHSIEASIESKSELDSLIEKARIVRSRAFMQLRKYPNSTADAKKVLVRNATNRDAQGILNEIKAAQAYSKSVDKKLSKEVCRWVQSATESTVGSEALRRTK